MNARSSASATCSASDAATRSRVVASSSFSARPARLRIISDSAQNDTPSPYDGERPSCQNMASAMPSLYLLNSHASRLLPMPASPEIATSRARRSRATAWYASRRSRNSVSRPTNGGSSASARPAPRTRATTRSARNAGTGAALPFSDVSPAGSNAIASSVAARVDSPTSTVPGRATDCSRAAVFTRSPATSPWSTAPSVTAASPVSTPARATSSRPSARPTSATDATRSRAARTARSASSSCATGAPQTAMTASPMNFSTVPP